jgi:hypothetical protein
MTSTKARSVRLGPSLLLVPLLAVAVVSFVFITAKHGDGSSFVAAQRQAQALTPASVASVVRLAPDPATHARGRRARCRPEGSGELYNPWSCTISYAAGKRIQYRVQIHADGSFVGSDQRLTAQGRTISTAGQITGCCIVVP